MALLEVKGLTAATGRSRSSSASTSTVDEGEVVVVLGANGAGKTTTLRAICGMIADQGDVTFDGDADRRRSRPRPSASRASPTCPRAGARSPT